MRAHVCARPAELIAAVQTHVAPAPHADAATHLHDADLLVPPRTLRHAPRLLLRQHLRRRRGEALALAARRVLCLRKLARQLRDLVAQSAELLFVAIALLRSRCDKPWRLHGEQSLC